MKRFISSIAITVFISIGLSTGASAQQAPSSKPMQAKKIQNMDRKMTKQKAIKRSFKSQKEFKRAKQKRRAPQKRVTNRTQRRVSHNNARDIFSGRQAKKIETRRYIEDDYWYDDSWDYPRTRQYGYNNFKRGWYLAYRYDRASFNDRYGYHYGYFNRHGFYFDGVFYAYDRYYRYKDRMRGRGAFDRKYYMPTNRSYYGFATPRLRQRTLHRR
ncbi:MAG TPA: hypothetical protein EYG98_01680 [Sulfurovum sp.]|nr:hypothetical protein [Sulfurovum sp.]